MTYIVPDDFPRRLRRFKEESDLSWSETARRLGTYRNTVWRWAEGRTRPNYQHRRALLALADGLSRDALGPTTPSQCKSPSYRHAHLLVAELWRRAAEWIRMLGSLMSFLWWTTRSNKSDNARNLSMQRMLHINRSTLSLGGQFDLGPWP